MPGVLSGLRGAAEGHVPPSQGLTIRGPLEKGVAKPLQYSCLQKPMNKMKKQKDVMTTCRLVGVQ